jgi:cell wall-associated NlpC family hydrolase
MTIVASLVVAPAALAQTPGALVAPGAAVDPAPAVPVPSSTSAEPVIVPSTGGAVYGAPDAAYTQLTTGPVATVLPSGYAAAPALAPPEVKRAIAAANAIVGKPYVYGGGHNRRFSSRGYDCSGTVSYALHGGRLLTSPLDSRAFASWGRKGVGAWITVYTKPSHAYAVIAGLRLDTSAAGDPSGLSGPRWRPLPRSAKGFTARHPADL